MPSLSIWKGTQLLVVQVESGRNAAGDRIRFTDVFRGPLQLCYNVQPPRGAFGTLNYNGLGIDRRAYVVNQSDTVPERGGLGKLTIEWEAGGSYAGAIALPVGSFSLKPQEIYPKVERNPFFQTPEPIKLETIQKVYTALYGNGLTAQNNGINAIRALSNSDPQNIFANKLLEKLMQGTETYYVAGWRYTFEVFSYSMPVFSRGGYIGSPGGPLAGNLPSGTSWLRVGDEADSSGVAGSMYKVTQNWIGGPLGHWDPDLYTG